MNKKTLLIIPFLIVLLCASIALASPTIDTLSNLKPGYLDHKVVKGNCIATEDSSASFNYTIELIDPSDTVRRTKTDSAYEFESEYLTLPGLNKVRCTASNATNDGHAQSTLTFLVKSGGTQQQVVTRELARKDSTPALFGILFILIIGALFLWYWFRRKEG